MHIMFNKCSDKIPSSPRNNNQTNTTTHSTRYIKQAEKIKIHIARQYLFRKRKVDRCIKSLRRKITKCDPLRLLSLCADSFLLNTGTVQSEYQLGDEEIINSRLTEYAQSVIVSSKSKYKNSRQDTNKLFESIQCSFKELEQLIDLFYISWSFSVKEQHPEFDEETQRTLIEAQLFFSNVRGKRYQVHEIEYLERLLSRHDSVFRRAFNISAENIIEGIKKLQFSLSQGKAESINRLGDLFDKYTINKESDLMEDFLKQHHEDGQRFVEEFFGTKLFDVLAVTGWPLDFVESMSLGINEFPEFFERNEFSGWPIIDLPIQRKPFIKIGDRFYCFDYYSLMDNFYRVIQKTITKRVKDYNWGDVQKEASEQMVADVFSTLLPGCTVYRDNYYPTGHGNRAENDILITYLDTLFIIEVKAGSFVYTSPILDFAAHMNSYKALVEKADHQCQNIYQYLTSRQSPIIYDGKNSKKYSIDMSKVVEVFMLSVTMDNINDFAARTEKLSFLKLKSHAISISIDDLMVCRDYFDSPLVFLHYMKQRRQAVLEPKLALNDELDHLGLYIENNMYCLPLRGCPEDVSLYFNGFREELDKYFCALYHPSLHPEKPIQKMPRIISQILAYLSEYNVSERRLISEYFLNFSSTARNEFDNAISSILDRQQKTKRMLALNTAGNSENSIRYTLFINQPHVETLSDNYQRQYTLSTLLWNEETNRTLIKLSFDEELELVNIEFRTFTSKDISLKEIDSLQRIAYERARLRVFIAQQKIGSIPDDALCPCGSDKKYSICCRDRFGHS